MLTFRPAALAIVAVGLALPSAPALADTAMLSRQSAIHTGPGNEFEIVGYLDAGRVELGRCGPNARQENWCYVPRDVLPGWIHVVLRGKPGAPAGMGSDGPKGSPKALAGGGAPVDTTGAGRGRAAAGGSGDGGTSDTGTGRGRDAAGGSGDGGSASDTGTGRGRAAESEGPRSHDPLTMDAEHP